MLQPGVLQNQLLQALLQTDEGVVFYLSEDDKGDDWKVVETLNLMGVSLMTSLVILLVLNTSPYSRSTLQFTIVRFFILPPVLKRKRCKKMKNTKKIQKTFGGRRPCWQGWCSHRALQCPGYGAFLNALCQDFGCGLAQYDLQV